MSARLNDAMSAKAASVQTLGEMVAALQAMASEGRNVAAITAVARQVEAVENAAKSVDYEVGRARQEVEKANRARDAMRGERDDARRQLQSGTAELHAKEKTLEAQRTWVKASAGVLATAFLATGCWAVWLRWQPVKTEYREVQVPLLVPHVDKPVAAAQKPGRAESNSCGAAGSYAAAFGCGTITPR